MQAPPDYSANESSWANQAGPSNQRPRQTNGGNGKNRYGGEAPSGWNVSYSEGGGSRATRGTRGTRATSSSRAPVPEGADPFEVAGGAYRAPDEEVNFEEKYKFFGNSKQIQYVPQYSEKNLKKAAKLVREQGISFKEAARVCNCTVKDLKYYYDHHGSDLMGLPQNDPFNDEDTYV
eukprot:TRINITY_DN37_c1_g1_i2.p3 TRINITY_DN37_c1_g1~~TRINITY_DN37_c1_g1_i2.p3  ORF type:complete len:177 (-),score=24.14 TRINITY_DN37_c1_g1_i2:1112-1642(-)